MKLLHLPSSVYIRGLVHRNSRLKKSNKMQQFADIYLLLNYSKCFGRPSRPSSGIHKSVFAASGTEPLGIPQTIYNIQARKYAINQTLR